MLPVCFHLNSRPRFPTNLALAIRIGSRRVTHRPEDSVAELSGGTGDSVAELSGTESVRWGPDHRASPTLMADTAKGSSPSPGARSLASQALRHQGTLHASIGAAVPSTVPEEWDPPSRAG